MKKRISGKMNLRHFIRLSRPINLVIIAATMYAIQYLVIDQMLINLNDAGVLQKQVHLQISDLDFLLLTLSTMMIAAGGYIINDYFDVKADRINKPEKVIIDKHIKRRVGMMAHVTLNLLAVAIGGYLSIKYSNIWVLVIHLISTSLLWFYSLYLKRKFLVGNIIIAFLAWLTPVLVGLMELELLSDIISQDTTFKEALRFEFLGSIEVKSYGGFIALIWLIVMLFASFAFLANLIREIIKDLADIVGDLRIGCRTLPIVMGIRKTKILSTFLFIGFIGTLNALAFVFNASTVIIAYVELAICLPLFLSAITLIRANKRNKYLISGNFLKIAMLTGIGYALIIYYYTQT